MKSNSSYLTGVIYCFIATLVWGGMFPIMTHALKIIDPFTFTAMRYSIACIIFLIFLAYKEGKKAFRLDGNILLLSFFGSAGFAGFGFFVFLGQQLAGPEGALSASMMMATMPLLGLLVNWVLKGIKPALYSLGFIFLSFLGVLTVITRGNLELVFVTPGNYVANLFMISGALCWVVYTIGATFFSKWSPIKYTALSTLFGLPTIYMVTTILILTHKVVVPQISSIELIVPSLMYMALIAGFVGVLCWNQGNKIITPINGVLFMDVVPITAFIISACNGVVPTWTQLIGVCMTVSALILNNMYQRYRMHHNSTIVSAKA